MDDVKHLPANFPKHLRKRMVDILTSPSEIQNNPNQNDYCHYFNKIVKNVGSSSVKVGNSQLIHNKPQYVVVNVIKGAMIISIV